MYAAIPEMNTQTFIPQMQDVSKVSQPKTSFRDVMKQVNDDSSKDLADMKDDVATAEKEQPKDDLKAEDQPSQQPADEKEVNLLVQQMAVASLTVPVIPVLSAVEMQPQLMETSAVTDAQSMEADALQQLPVQPTTDTAVTATVVTAQELSQPVVKAMNQNGQTSAEGEVTQQTDAQEPVIQKVSSAAAENSSQSDTGELTQGQLKPEQQQTSDTEEKSELKAAEQQVVIKPERLDPSKVNVKVGEGPVQTDSPKFAQELVDKIMYQAQNGKTQFELELNPGDMGTIRIKLVFEEGKASVMMSCSNVKTEQLLMSTAEQIRSIIQSQTGSDTQVHVKQEAYQSQQDMDGRGENPNKERQKEEQRNDDSTVDATVFLQQMKLGLIGKEE